MDKRGVNNNLGSMREICRLVHFVKLFIVTIHTVHLSHPLRCFTQDQIITAPSLSCPECLSPVEQI